MENKILPLWVSCSNVIFVFFVAIAMITKYFHLQSISTNNSQFLNIAIIGIVCIMFLAALLIPFSPLYVRRRLWAIEILSGAFSFSIVFYLYHKVFINI